MDVDRLLDLRDEVRHLLADGRQAQLRQESV